MSRRPKNPLRRRLERLATRLIAGSASLAVRLLPMRWVQACARALAYPFMLISTRRQRLADAGLQAVFGDRYSRAERRRLRVEMSKSICCVFPELFKLSTYSRERVARDCPIDGEEHLRTALARGKGAVVVGAHFGNWEWAAACAVARGFDLAVVVNQASDQGVTSTIDSAREACGYRVLQRDDLRGMLRQLRSGGMLAILPDQHQRDNSILLDFLGLPAWTAQGPAVLAMRTGAALVPSFGIRQPDGSVLSCFLPEITPSEKEDRDEATAETMQRINDLLGEVIRRHPGQWLWLHDRWKDRRPPDEEEADRPSA